MFPNVEHLCVELSQSLLNSRKWQNIVFNSKVMVILILQTKVSSYIELIFFKKINIIMCTIYFDLKW